MIECLLSVCSLFSCCSNLMTFVLCHEFFECIDCTEEDNTQQVDIVGTFNNELDVSHNPFNVV